MKAHIYRTFLGNAAVKETLSGMNRLDLTGGTARSSARVFAREIQANNEIALVASKRSTLPLPI
jgi:hypothetical protein